MNARGILVPSGPYRHEDGIFHSDPFHQAEVPLPSLAQSSGGISALAEFHIDAMNEIFGAAGMIYQRSSAT